MGRIINYEIKTEYISRKISEFLKSQGYPEKCLTKLRHTEGALKIDGKVIHMNYKPSAEDSLLTVEIKEDESPSDIPPTDMALDILYEDEDILVINKEPFVPIHPSINNYENTLANAVAFYYEKQGKPFVYRCINRLDRDTTGITILAKHYLAAGILADSMKRREIHREYTAIVEGVPDPIEGTIDMPIARECESVIKRVVDFEKGERAVTHYKVTDTFRNRSKVVLNLETGRTHQIRVHMKAIGHPLLGDFLYNPEDKSSRRQALHAGKISFVHPVTKKEMTITAPMPEDMKLLID